VRAVAQRRPKESTEFTIASRTAAHDHACRQQLGLDALADHNTVPTFARKPENGYEVRRYDLAVTGSRPAVEDPRVVADLGARVARVTSGDGRYCVHSLLGQKRRAMVHPARTCVNAWPVASTCRGTRQLQHGTSYALQLRPVAATLWAVSPVTAGS